MSKQFFIVFNPEGKTPPVQQHGSHKEAFAIAHHMAKLHPTETFFVMKSCSKPIAAAVEVEAAA